MRAICAYACDSTINWLTVRSSEQVLVGPQGAFRHASPPRRHLHSERLGADEKFGRIRYCLRIQPPSVVLKPHECVLNIYRLVVAADLSYDILCESLLQQR